MEKKRKGYFACPVRNIDPVQKMMRDTIFERLSQELDLYYPPVNTKQNSMELDICHQNLRAIQQADVVIVFWDGKSQGVLFDMGIAFALSKKIIVAYAPQETEEKSFQNMFYQWEERFKDGWL